MSEEQEPAVNVKTVAGLSGYKLVAMDGYGHSLIMDTFKEVGGTEEGFTPGRLLMAALGGCTLMDMVLIMRKRRQYVTSIEVSVESENAPEHPKYYTKFRLKYSIHGRNLTEDEVSRAIKLSHEKYCVVGATVEGRAKIETSYEIHNTT
jgi:putative redox protein